MRSMTFFSLLILWGAILCNNALSNTNIPSNSILATVNGHAVTLGEVLKESSSSEALAKAYTEQKEISGAVAKLRQDTVDRIIDRKLLIDEFTRLKLFLPPKYIESMLDDLAINLNCRSRSELAAKARALNSSIYNASFRDTYFRRIRSWKCTAYLRTVLTFQSL